MTTINDAQDTLQNLRTKLDEAQSQADEIRAAIKEIAFEAHSGDAVARKQLDKLIADEGKQLPEIRSIEEAITVAQRRVAEARAAETDADAKGRAEKTLVLIDSFEKRGAALDKKFAAAIAEYVDLSNDFRQLDALGYAPTTWALVKINMRAAVATKLQFTDLRQDFLAPKERRDFIAVIAGWSQNVRAKATARLNKPTAEKAA